MHSGKGLPPTSGIHPGNSTQERDKATCLPDAQDFCGAVVRPQAELSNQHSHLTLK